ncbi:MAG: arginase family protein, partial [Mycobacterium sp.]|nr:arginase family protein [Mycobacterium sp.]
RVLRGLAGSNLVGVDVVEVCPAYDHANITGIAASHIAYEAISLMALHDSPKPTGAATRSYAEPAT